MSSLLESKSLKSLFDSELSMCSFFFLTDSVWPLYKKSKSRIGRLIVKPATEEGLRFGIETGGLQDLLNQTLVATGQDIE